MLLACDGLHSMVIVIVCWKRI